MLRRGIAKLTQNFPRRGVALLRLAQMLGDMAPIFAKLTQNFLRRGVALLRPAQMLGEIMPIFVKLSSRLSRGLAKGLP